MSTSNIAIIISGISIVIAVAAITMLMSVTSELELVQKNMNQEQVRPGMEQQGAFGIDPKAMENVMEPTKNLQAMETKKITGPLWDAINNLKSENKELKNEIFTLRDRLEGIKLVQTNSFEIESIEAGTLKIYEKDCGIPGNILTSVYVSFSGKEFFYPDEVGGSGNNEVHLQNVNIMDDESVEIIWICAHIEVPEE